MLNGTGDVHHEFMCSEQLKDEVEQLLKLSFSMSNQLLHSVSTYIPEIEYAFTLQEDLHSMYKWSQDWQLLFNFTKCKCLHIGYNNPNCDYFMGDVRIESIDMEKDLGVHIHKSLKVKEQSK